MAVILDNAQLPERKPGVTQDQKERLEIIISRVYRVERLATSSLEDMYNVYEERREV